MRGLLLVLAVTGCVDGKTDYGMPSATTKIDMVEAGGFAPSASSREVHIDGGNASFVNFSQSGVGLIDDMQVQDVIDALANVHFLRLAADWTHCTNASTDQATVSFAANLDDAGSNTIQYYLGCSGGEFDLLRQLETKIFDASGFTTWSTTR